MKINLEQEIRTITGEPVKDENKKNLTLKPILVSAALQETDKDEKKKVSDFQLALKIQNADKEVELDSKDIVRLQEKIKIGYTRLIVGQVYELLEGHTNPIKSKKQ